jgi:hypothetical protein
MRLSVWAGELHDAGVYRGNRSLHRSASDDGSVTDYRSQVQRICGIWRSGPAAVILFEHAHRKRSCRFEPSTAPPVRLAIEAAGEAQWRLDIRVKHPATSRRGALRQLRLSEACSNPPAA